MGCRRYQCLAVFILLSWCWSAIAEEKKQYDVIVFDEDDAIGSDYYDASVGWASQGSDLARSGSYKDKLPIADGIKFFGKCSGYLGWKSAVGGSWRMLVANPGFARRRIAGYRILSLRVNAPSAIPSEALPEIGLESASNEPTLPIRLGQFLPQGIDGDTNSWQVIQIPLTVWEPFGRFDALYFKGIYFQQGSADKIRHEFWFDDVRFVAPRSRETEEPPPIPKNLLARVGDRSVALHWDIDRQEGLLGYEVYRKYWNGLQAVKLTSAPVTIQSFADLSVTNGEAYHYEVAAVDQQGNEGPRSAGIDVTPEPFRSRDDFLDLVQQTAFDYFWYEANPGNGLIRDRSEAYAPASVAAVGFGLTALGIGVDHQWISREQAQQRALTTLRTLWALPQGTNVTTTGYKGWYYHFLEMDTGERAWRCELSSVDTALLLAGVIYSRSYFDAANAAEDEIRTLAAAILKRVDWNWMANGGRLLAMGWRPESGFLGSTWQGYNEAMVLYLMAIGSEQDAMPASTWNEWSKTYKWKTYYGQSFVVFPPLFGHQYSHCWVDFRNISDQYMTLKGSDYFENSRRAVLAQRAYCLANPGKFAGYGKNVWGLTACDGPGTPGFQAYMARGAAPAEHDDGTIAPTAISGSTPFTPEESITALRYLYDSYREKIWTGYGFRDAFNLQANWWGPDVIGIDQGPMLLMIENYRTGSVWKTFMKAQEIRAGLERAGFKRVVKRQN